MKRLAARIRFGIGMMVALFACNGLAQPHPETALILMHGKWGSPPGPLASFFERSGYTVESPTMPWAGNRGYDIAYGQALDDLHREVARLRAQGAKRVIIGGHSFGANGALAYAAKFQDIDAVMLFAPGHRPEAWYENGKTEASVDEARRLSRAGKGSDRFGFTDYNQGKSRGLSATVDVYLSYFDPDGPGNMPENSRRIKASIPVFCVMSSGEQALGRAYLFDNFPANPKSVYLETPASHQSAPESVSAEALKFVESIATP